MKNCSREEGGGDSEKGSDQLTVYRGIIDSVYCSSVTISCLIRTFFEERSELQKVIENSDLKLFGFDFDNQIIQQTNRKKKTEKRRNANRYGFKCYTYDRPRRPPTLREIQIVTL